MATEAVARASEFGLPGRLEDTSWVLPATLPSKEIVRALHLLGRITKASPWWAADALLYAEEKLGEAFAQAAEELDWSPHTLQNVMWVGRSVPKNRRRAALSWSHHEAVAALSPAIQEVWLEKAERGESLPGGGSQRWSVTRLRTELRALKPKKGVADEPVPALSNPGGIGGTDSNYGRGTAELIDEEIVVHPNRPTLWLGKQQETCPLALGCILDIPNFGRAEVSAISVGPVAALVTLVRAK